MKGVVEVRILTVPADLTGVMRIMNADERLAQLKEEFMRRMDEMPNDLAVPRYSRWDGPEPMPMADYQVQYNSDAARILRAALNGDQTLYPLRRMLMFQVVEESRLLVVSLARDGLFSV